MDPSRVVLLEGQGSEARKANPGQLRDQKMISYFCGHREENLGDYLLSQPRELASPPLPAGGLSGHRRGSRRVLAGRSPLAVAARGAAAAQLLGAVYRAPVHQVTLSLVTDDQSHLLRR